MMVLAAPLLIRPYSEVDDVVTFVTLRMLNLAQSNTNYAIFFIQIELFLVMQCLGLLNVFLESRKFGLTIARLWGMQFVRVLAKS